MNIRIESSAETIAAFRAAMESAPAPVEAPAGVEQFDVTCNRDGTVTLTADPETMARLAGRTSFGAVEPVQRLLEDRVADAWYAAGCPQA